jgi:cell division protein ZapA (FtsZ GTPase activity inhibitor)
MSEKHVQGINVQIFGEDYPIASEGDGDEVRRIAAYVDQKMQEIAQVHSGRLSTARVAVLAAMEITVELFRAMQERNQLTERAHENLGRLTKLIEERASISGERVERTPSSMEQLLQKQPAIQQD